MYEKMELYLILNCILRVQDFLNNRVTPSFDHTRMLCLFNLQSINPHPPLHPLISTLTPSVWEMVSQCTSWPNLPSSPQAMYHLRQPPSFCHTPSRFPATSKQSYAPLPSSFPLSLFSTACCFPHIVYCLLFTSVSYASQHEVASQHWICENKHTQTQNIKAS